MIKPTYEQLYDYVFSHRKRLEAFSAWLKKKAYERQLTAGLVADPLVYKRNEVLAILGISDQTLRRWLIRLDIPKRGGQHLYTKADLEKLKQRKYQRWGEARE